MTELDQGTGESQPADDIRSALASAIAAQDDTPAPEPVKPAKPAPKEDTGLDKDSEQDRLLKWAKEQEEGGGEEHEPKPRRERKGAKDAKDAKDDATAKDDKAAEAQSGKEPPANWQAPDKETFKTLPEPAKDFLLRRHKDMEADYTKKTQAISDLKKEYEPVDAFFAPHKDVMRAKGFTPRTLIESWGKVESELAAGPDNAVRIVQGLVKGYNIPVDKIAAALGIKATQVPAADGQPPAAEHVQAQLPPELLDRLNRVEQFTANEDLRRAQEAQARIRDLESRVMTEIETFKSASDKDGNPLHPHFEDVEADMTALANAHLAMKQPVPPLDKLYESAVWANPSTREKVRTAETQAAEKKRTDEARAKTAAAKKASASVTGAPGAGQAPSGRRGSELSLREQLLEAADDAA